MNLDNLEHISIKNQVTNFPKHFHETFCISLIKEGVELIQFNNQNLYCESGCISITNPYEIHANPLIDTKNKLHFDTLYISVDLMKYLVNGKNIIFNNRKIYDYKANTLFTQISKAIDEKDFEKTEQLLTDFIHIIQQYSQEKKENYKGLNFKLLHNIDDYIEHNITKKFNLDELAKITNINKFGFAKKFKLSTGMSAMNYIQMKKIFSSKSLITKQSELTQLAIDYNFSDLSHYSKTFKRYVGISPKAFQKFK